MIFKKIENLHKEPKQHLKKIQVLLKNNKCFYCSKKPTHYSISNKNNVVAIDIKNNIEFNFDHMIPRSKGGSNFSDNLVLSCKFCNSKKGDRIFKFENKPKMRLFYILENYKDLIPKGSLVSLFGTDLINATIFYNGERYVVPVLYIGGSNIIKERINFI